MINHKTYTLVFLLCLTQSISQAQNKVHVVIKTIYKEFDYKEGKVISVLGEKSQIEIKGWPQNKVSLELKLITKHTDKETALHDMMYNDYQVISDEDKISFRNSFNTSEHYTKVKSNLSAQYTIHVPYSCILHLKNSYGSITIENAGHTIKIESLLTPIILNNITGNVSVNSQFGNIISDHGHGSLAVKADKSDITINNQKGSCTVNNEYGKMNVIANSDTDLVIHSKYSSINIYVKEFSSHTYDLQVTAGEIFIPDQLKNKIVKKTLTQTFNNTRGTTPDMTINTFFSSIHIMVIN